MTAYYNEIDPYAAQWLRNLIAAGHIAPGEVDERSIEDVRPDELAGFTQCHFFAGVGVWSYALRLSGWPDDRPVWTGSCPCQPFSAAGKGAGFDDERHLWPAWFHIIGQCRPAIVFGEQVASKDGLGWLDLVSADMEGSGYAFGAADLCVAGVGAPHIRQRLWFVAQWLEHATGDGRDERRAEPGRGSASGGRGAVVLGDTIGARLEGHAGDGDNRNEPGWDRTVTDGSVAETSGFGRMADAGRKRNELRRKSGIVGRETSEKQGEAPERERSWTTSGDCRPRNNRACPVNGFWRDADWLHCRDGKWRPVRPGSFPLVDGTPARVGRLRAYGNAINAEAARIFIESVMDIGGAYD